MATEGREGVLGVAEVGGAGGGVVLGERSSVGEGPGGAGPDGAGGGGAATGDDGAAGEGVTTEGGGVTEGDTEEAGGSFDTARDEE